MSVETDAIALAKRHFIDAGYAVNDVSRTRGHNGYDFIVERADTSWKIEVKGCTGPWHIPDLFETEFDQDRRLVADFLCVIYLMDPANPSMCLIPREAIPAEYVKPKVGYRISSRFKKESVLGAYIQPLPSWDEPSADA